jgi:UDPglucose--hexose-1-phosphate uridylyltransferase
VGGVEAPEPYDVRWFPNRWPAMDGERCEVVLYTSDHDATFWSLGAAAPAGDRPVGRTHPSARLADDVDFVLVFENRGPEVGATIAHPHGQIYAYDHVPERPERRLRAGWRPDPDPGDRLVVCVGGGGHGCRGPPRSPSSSRLAPVERVGSLLEMDDVERDELAGLLADVLERLDRLYDQADPLHDVAEPAPHDHRSGRAADYADAWFNIELVSPWRRAGVPRFIAAAEVACHEYFNPVVPEASGRSARRLPASAR